MSRSSVIIKTFKYLIYFIVLLALILLLLMTYLLHTESGSRLAIKQGIGFFEIELTYDNISGNLSDGLVIKNMRYKNQEIDVVIDHIAYQSDWSWFDRQLKLSKVKIDGVTVESKPTSVHGDVSQPFTGIELPLAIDIKDMTIQQLVLVSDTLSQTIDLIDLSAKIGASKASIITLKLQAAEFGLTTSGKLDYANGMNYVIEADWHAYLDGQSVKSKGPIDGNLNNIHFNQMMQVKTDQVEGLFNLQGEVTALQQLPVFNVIITAAKSQLLLQQNNLELKDFKVKLNGLIEDYKISIHTQLSQQQLNDFNLPVSELTVEAVGNSQQLTTQKASIITPEGSIDLTAAINWQDQFTLSSQLTLSAFNPAQFLAEWPGSIGGQVDMDLSVTEQGLTLSTKNNNLNGQLKGQKFTLTGSADYATGTLSTNQLQVKLGENLALINGQLNQQHVALKADVEWVDLSLLDAQLTGSITGSVELTGDHLNPHVKANLVGQKLTFDQHQVSTLSLQSKGKWNQVFDTSINIDNALIGGQEFNVIQIVQSGWLDGHEVKIALDNNEFNSELKLQGQYNKSTNAGKPANWVGQITSHEVIVDSNKKIKLQAPIAIEVAEKIKIEAGCWQGVEAGTLCIELNDFKQVDTKYQGSLTLDAFSLTPLQVLLPDDIVIIGKLQGAADFSLQAKELTVESSLELKGGELRVLKEQKVVYESAIEKFEINANTTNQEIDISIKTQLADNSYLNLQSKLENPDGQAWLINASIEGLFFSTDLIKELTEEIKALEGQVSISGHIEGPLSKPKINFNFSQADGYIALTRLGTVIENLKISVNTEGITQPVYNIKFSGSNLAALNQGQVESNGVLSFSADQQWQYQGQITGKNFMLLNLPEAKFNISPDLFIDANHLSTDINGHLIIDSGHVVVKQLPASSVSNSADLVIHTSEISKESNYPISMNIQASIKDPIELDVIGLVAGLTGSIQLTQSKQQALAGKGILNLSDGSYEIYGQKLDINQGELAFTGPLDNPRLKVKASRKSISGDVVAGVELGGTVNNLQSNLYSEPSLSDIEKLSYILTGRGVENSGSLDGESLKQAAVVMGLNQSSPIFNQIQSQFGIDVLTVRESALAADTVVEAGKKINDKLYVSYNQGLFNRLGFWKLKYKINQFLNLETTQGEDQSIELVYTRKAEIKNFKQKEKIKK